MGIAQILGWWQNHAKMRATEFNSNLTDPTCSDISFAEFSLPFP